MENENRFEAQSESEPPPDFYAMLDWMESIDKSDVRRTVHSVGIMYTGYRLGKIHANAPMLEEEIVMHNYHEWIVKSMGQGDDEWTDAILRFYNHNHQAAYDGYFEDFRQYRAWHESVKRSG